MTADPSISVVDITILYNSFRFMGYSSELISSWIDVAPSLLSASMRETKEIDRL